MCADINMLTSTLLPNVLIEIGMPRAPFKRRVGDILTYFATPTPQAATPKVSAVALNTYVDPHSDLRNLTHYITRALLEIGGFNTQLHPPL